MLKYFKIKNFKSIVETVVDFTYDESRTPSKEYLNLENEDLVFLPNNNILTKKDNRIAPVSVFYGANASGKSNFIDCFSIFKSVVFGQLKPTKYKPNKLNCSSNSTTFEVCFVENNKQYKYKIEYNDITIVTESLIVGDKNIFLIENNNIKELNFTKNDEKNPYLQNKYIIDYYKSIKNDSANIFSFLYIINNNIPNTNSDIKIVFNTIKSISFLPLPSFFLRYPVLIKNSTDSEEDNINETITAKYIKKFDIDIDKIEYDNSKNEYYTLHKNSKGEDIRFDMSDESDGTQILLNLIPVMLKVLNKGQILVADELENSLHTKILFAIVKMFKNKSYNKHNAQLIFTTHNTDLLDNNILRRTEVNFIEKTAKQGTEIKRLSKKTRNTADFRKQYLEGLYGAIPLIEEL